MNEELSLPDFLYLLRFPGREKVSEKYMRRLNRGLPCRYLISGIAPDISDWMVRFSRKRVS